MSRKKSAIDRLLDLVLGPPPKHTPPKIVMPPEEKEERIKVKATPRYDFSDVNKKERFEPVVAYKPLDKVQELQNKITQANELAQVRSEPNPAVHLVERDVISRHEVGAQYKQANTWSSNLMVSVAAYLSELPPHYSREKIVEDLKKKYSVVEDPPSLRFKGALFSRPPIFIDRKEVARLKDWSGTFKHHEDKAPTDKPNYISQTRLEEMVKTGKIEAQSDENWFKDFKVPPPVEQHMTAELEKRESFFIEKMKHFLIAKRHLAVAKQRMGAEYNRLFPEEPEEKSKPASAAVTD